MRDARADALKAFKALRLDIEQFDTHDPINSQSDQFSSRVPAYMKSYLVNWLRRFVKEHGDLVQERLTADTKATE